MANTAANISNFINGEWLPGSGAELVTINPATGQQTWSSNESTAQDVARGKPSEIDHLNGYIVRRGQAHGIATPVNLTVHALVKLIESKAR